MKLPCKDPNTIPWMTPREIPAIKAALSAWRKLRRDRTNVQRVHHRAEICSEPDITAEERAHEIAWDLELIAAIDERLRKEAKNGKRA